MKHLSYNVVNTTIECYIHFLETFAVYAGEEEDDSAVHHVFDLSRLSDESQNS